jgi:hypothetical protein
MKGVSQRNWFIDRFKQVAVSAFPHGIEKFQKCSVCPGEFLLLVVIERPQEQYWRPPVDGEQRVGINLEISPRPQKQKETHQVDAFFRINTKKLKSLRRAVCHVH